MRGLALLTVLSVVAVPLALVGGPDAAPRFTDDTFADFAAGTLDAGGQNLYVSRDGAVRTIHRFDLNNDGHLDLVFNCTHDTYQMLPATVGLIGRDRATRSADLAVEGSQRVVLGDLDGDGFTDAVFCPNPIGLHGDRRHVTIAWGGADGWSARRLNGALPVHGATTVALPDLNADGRPDVAVLCGHRWRPEQPDGQIVRVFWNGPDGFSPVEYRDLAVPPGLDLAAADFDSDGAPDLAVLSGASVSVLWATKAKGERPVRPDVSDVKLPIADVTSLTAADVTGDKRPDLIVGSAGERLAILSAKAGRVWGDPVTVPAVGSSQIAAADLDADGAADLVLTSFTQVRAAGGEQAGAGSAAPDRVRVLWGKGGTFGDTTVLPVPYAAAAGVGDLDGDGHADVVVAVHQGKETFNGESVVFYGDGARKFTRGASGFRTSGTTDVAVAPAAKGLPGRAVFCNSIGGRLDEAVPIHVYWGGAKGFDPAKVWKLPFHSAYEASAADLNADGHTDLVCLNSGHAGESSKSDPTLGANIFWGAAGGFDPEKRRAVITESFLGTSTPADLNKDGYLDLVLEPFGPAKPGEVESLFIYLGGPNGFTPKRKTALPKPGYGQEHLVVDCNGDGWLDIVTTSMPQSRVRVWWGGPDGFDVMRGQTLTASGATGVSAADLNKDGRADLVVSCYNDQLSGYRDMGLLIFWGRDGGFRSQDSQWLPGFSPLGRSVADLDGDGWLDIVSPQQSGELTREDLACHIYWGGPDGFARARRTTLFCDSVNATLAADYDGDGRLDLAVACHTRHGDHRSQSRVFYNDDKRFEAPRLQKLPTNGPHLMWATEVGHILDRTYRQAFTSRPFTWDGAAAGGTLVAKADLGPGRTLAFEVRSAGKADDLIAKAWVPVKDGGFALAAGDRCLQYRAVLASDNGDRYPVLDRVDVTLRK